MIAPIRSIPIDFTSTRPIQFRDTETEARVLAEIGVCDKDQTGRVIEALTREEVCAAQCPASLLIAHLGWATQDARQARARLSSFEDDWAAPGMEEYDRL